MLFTHAKVIAIKLMNVALGLKVQLKSFSPERIVDGRERNEG
jgi:hypothetical protein